MKAEILALLEAGPEMTSTLADYLDADEAAIALMLAQMQDAGDIKRVKVMGDRCWALPSYVPPAPKRTKRIVRQPVRPKPVMPRIEDLVEIGPPTPFVRPHVPMTRVLVIDGVECIAESVGSRPIGGDWPPGMSHSTAAGFEHHQSGRPGRTAGPVRRSE